ncbi:hypothetical protein U2A4042340002 [Corynebacterium striatum]|nr:hypothetical protein U2A4042340002 [Corynebacterium striatum]
MGPGPKLIFVRVDVGDHLVVGRSRFTRKPPQQRPPNPYRRLRHAQGHRPNRTGRIKQTAGPTTRNPAVPGLRNTGTQNPHLTIRSFRDMSRRPLVQVEVISWRAQGFHQLLADLVALAGSWLFFGDTVVIIGETPSRSEPHTNFLTPPAGDYLASPPSRAANAHESTGR